MNNNIVDSDYMYDDEEEISISELLGFNARHFWQIVLCCVVCTAIGLGVGFYNGASRSGVSKYNSAMTSYYDSIKMQESTISRLESRIAALKKYVDSISESDIDFKSFLEATEGVSSSQEIVLTTQAFKYYLDTKNSLDDSVKRLETEKRNLDSLKGNVPVQFKLKKPALIGFALGFVLSIGVCSCVFLFKGLIGSSTEFEERTGLAFLGTVYRKKKFENFFIKDRFFDSEDSAKAYAAANLSILKPFDSALLVSTETVSDDSKKKIADMFDVEVSFVENALTNPDLVFEAQKSELIIVLDKLWKTNEKDTRYLISSLERIGKTAKGFIVYID